MNVVEYLILGIHFLITTASNIHVHSLLTVCNSVLLIFCFNNYVDDINGIFKKNIRTFHDMYMYID